MNRKSLNKRSSEVITQFPSSISQQLHPPATPINIHEDHPSMSTCPHLCDLRPPSLVDFSREQEMGCVKGVVLLVILQAISLPHQPRGVAGDILSPLLSPVQSGVCKSAYCGKGICKVSDNHSLGFVCQCNEGWSQYHIEDYFRFLPCLIPNCSINYSCSNSSIPPTAAPLPSPPDKLSLFNPCTWSFCGGGECVRSSTFEHRCECKPNYSNLLNISSFPCYKDCSIGADCKNLGISISNSSSSFSSSSSSVSPTVTGNESSSSGYHALQNLLWFVALMISHAMI